MYQNLDILMSHGAEHVLILAGDHIYKMDYAAMLAWHIQRGADVPVPCVEVPRMEAAASASCTWTTPIRSSASWRRADPPAIPGKPDKALASMGIYMLASSCTTSCAATPPTRPPAGFRQGPDPLSGAARQGHGAPVPGQLHLQPAGRRALLARRRHDRRLLEANLDLTTVTPDLNLYDRGWPIFTYQEQLPPAKFVFNSDDRRGMAVDSLVSGGCIISGARIQDSLLFSQVRANSYSSLNQAVVLPQCEIGRHARLTKVVVDRGAHAGQSGGGEDPTPMRAGSTGRDRG